MRTPGSTTNRWRWSRAAAAAAFVLVCCAAAPAAGDAESGTTEGNRMRDPFWPIGFRPERPAGASGGERPADGEEATYKGGASQWTAALKELHIDGVSRKDERMIAVVNGEIVEPGDMVTAELGGLEFRWRLESVQEDGSLRFKRLKILKTSTGKREGGTP